MKLPNRQHAIVAKEKLTEYLLNLKHKRGSSKAQLLQQFGYSPENWERLASDIRKYHLETEIDRVRETPYGIRYEIAGEFLTPKNRVLLIRTVWQIDEGSDVPRFITLIPQ